MERPVLLLTCLCNLVSFAFASDAGPSPTPPYKSPWRHLSKTTYCAGHRHGVALEIRAVQNSSDDHGHDWLAFALSHAQFVSVVSVKFRLPELASDSAAFSNSTEAYVGYLEPNFWNDSFTNGSIWQQFTIANTVADSTAFKKCGTFGKMYNMTGRSFDSTNWKMSVCGFAGNVLLYRVKAGSPVNFYDCCHFDDDQAFLTRISKANTRKAWQSGGDSAAACWHTRSDEDLRASFWQPFIPAAHQFISVGRNPGSRFAWFAAVLSKPRLVGEVWVTVPGDHDAFFRKMKSTEILGSPAAVDFGSEHCSTNTFKSVMDSLASDFSPKKFSLCERQTEIFEAKETWRAKCGMWVQTLVVQMETAGSIMAFMRLSVVDSVDETVRPSPWDARRFSLESSTQSSSKNLERTCLAKSDKSADNEFVLQFHPAKATESGFHWFAVTMAEALPASFITLADPMNTAQNVEFYTSPAALNFGRSSCGWSAEDARAWSRLLVNRTTMSDLPAESRLTPCDNETFRVDKWHYALCYRWVRSVTVRLRQMLPDEAPSFENLAILPGYMKPYRMNVQFVNSGMTRLTFYPELNYTVECPSCPEQPTVEGSATALAGLRLAEEYRVGVRGVFRGNSIRGGTEFAFNTFTERPDVGHLNGTSTSCFTISWLSLANQKYTATCSGSDKTQEFSRLLPGQKVSVNCCRVADRTSVKVTLSDRKNSTGSFVAMHASLEGETSSNVNVATHQASSARLSVTLSWAQSTNVNARQMHVLNCMSSHSGGFGSESGKGCNSAQRPADDYDYWITVNSGSVSKTLPNAKEVVTNIHDR